MKQSSKQDHAENEESDQCIIQNYRIHLKLFLSSDLTNVYNDNKISSHLWDISMISVSLTVFFNTEINQSWNHNKADKAIKHMFSTDHQNLQNYFADYSENWDIHFFSESSSEFSCLSSTKKNEEKQHDMLN